MKKSETVLQAANIVAFLATVVVNALANALPINGLTTGEISDRYPNLFVPAGWTFSIWGIIYLLLAGFTAYQARGLFRAGKPEMPFLRRIGWLFVLASAANVSWILAWHHLRVGLSVLIMLVLLGSLIAVYQRLGIGLRKAEPGERVFVHLPFSVYLGWISIATIANITAFLVAAGWNRFGLSELFWTVLVLGVGLALALVMLIRRGDLAYAAVVIWAYVGIISRRATAGRPSPLLLAVLGISIGLITLGMVWRLARARGRSS